MRGLIVPLTVIVLSACSPGTGGPSETTTVPGPPADVPGPAAPDAALDNAGPVPAEPPLVDASQTQCVEGENYLYSCPLGGRTVVSVCVGNRQVAYRYGPLGDPELDLAVRQGEDGLWQGGVVGQDGGQQTHVRFRSGDYDYIVFSGYAGQLADDPGRRWSGVTVLRDGREVRRLDCQVQSSQTEIPSSMVPDYLPAEPEETAETYNAWY